MQVVVGEGPVIGAALVDAVDYVCFTGSTATGRTVAAQAGSRLIGASLELGGKNPFYVADDAHVGLAAECAVRSVVAGSGQLCMSTERLIVHADVHDAFMAAFLARVEKVRLGSDLDFAADMGSLTSQAQLDTVQRHVADAVEKGARVLAGGQGAARRRSAVPRADGAGRRPPLGGVLRRGDLRAGGVGARGRLRRRGGGAGQRHRVRPQRQRLDARHRARAAARRADRGRARCR